MPQVPPITEWLKDRTLGINGLAACPCCKSINEVRLRNRWCDDGITRFACFMCMACGFTGPDMAYDPPVPYQETGKVLFAPFRDQWNRWVHDLGDKIPEFKSIGD